MRFKLVLSVKSESFGSVLPVSYQYELSAAVYRRIRENFELYLHWLSSNGFAPIDDCRNRLFSFSNLYIPRIRVEYDRLHILVKRVQMWISFLPVRGTHEFVKQLFSGETFVLGDRRSRVELEVEDIVECPAPELLFKLPNTIGITLTAVPHEYGISLSRRYTFARGLSHERKTASIASFNCSTGSEGNSVPN